MPRGARRVLCEPSEEAREGTCFVRLFISTALFSSCGLIRCLWYQYMLKDAIKEYDI